jgi:hypothetical protein
MIDLLKTYDFFSDSDVKSLFNIVNSLSFIEKEYGFEIDHFNFIIPNLNPIFSKLLADDVIIDEENSGIFRRPKTFIHFESFNSLSDWIFIIALEPTIFNLYYHVPTNSKSALDQYQLNYRNFIEWNYYTHILLEPNQGIIFRPWLFHSLQNGIIQLYKLKGNINAQD